MTFETITLNQVTPDGSSVHHLLIYRRDELARGLVVLLPGRGYQIEHPLLHFLSKMAREQGFDVLQVRYSFQISGGELPVDWMDVLSREVSLAVDGALAQRNYTRLVFAGKSLGTPLAVQQGMRFPTHDVRYLLLTPIMGCTDQVGERPTYAVIGTADAAYSEERVAGDAAKPYVRWHVFEGLNHALEFGEGWDASIAVLGNIIAGCEAFLKAD